MMPVVGLAATVFSDDFECRVQADSIDGRFELRNTRYCFVAVTNWSGCESGLIVAIDIFHFILPQI